jgi:hypothetical protein
MGDKTYLISTAYLLLAQWAPIIFRPQCPIRIAFTAGLWDSCAGST